MSVAEIIKEFPKLTEAERRPIREVLLEIDNQDPNIALCNEAALEGAVLLDRMENEDAQDEGKQLPPRRPGVFSLSSSGGEGRGRGGLFLR